MFNFKLSRALAELQTQLKDRDESIRRLSAENLELEKSNKILTDTSLQYEHVVSELNAKIDAENKLIKDLGVCEVQLNGLLIKNSQIELALYSQKKEYDLKALNLETLKDKYKILSEILEGQSDTLTANYVLEKIQDMSEKESHKNSLLKEEINNLKSSLSSKANEIKRLESIVDSLKSAIAELTKSQNSAKEALNAAKEIFERDISTIKVAFQDKISEFNSEKNNFISMLEKFSSITPEHALVLRSISELKLIRTQLLNGPVIESARSKIRNSISQGKKSYEEARKEELEKGILTASQIDTIYQERKQFMPDHDARKTIMVTDSVSTQGGHDPYR